MAQSARTVILAAFIITALFLGSCALQLPPGGGEIDTVPPEIISVFPEPGTTGFDETYFELEFSEYVQKRTLKGAIFVSPAIDGSLELDWSGESVTVHFPDSLRKDMTYTVTIGTDVKDYNNNNRMAEAFTFVFSTGDRIDYGEISGKVYDQKAPGAMIFAYKLTGGIADTLNPASVKPDYISQAGNDGGFVLSGLSFGKYRVYAVEDEFRDLLFQSAQDRIGLPYKDFELSEEDSIVRFANFYLQEIDTTSPRLAGAIMTDRYHILLEFNEPVDSAVISTDLYTIIDSTNDMQYKPLYAFRGRAKNTEVVLSITDSLSEEHEYYIFGSGLSDPAGNVTDSEYVSLTVSTKDDTTAPTPAGFTPSRNFAIEILHSSFVANFNDAFDFNAAREYVSVTDTSGNTIPVSLSQIDDASFTILITEKLEPKTDYEIQLDLNHFKDAAGNTLDSVFVNRFQTLNDLNFTGISGTIRSLEPERNPVLLLENIDIAEKRYLSQPDSTGAFDIERVYPGNYILSLFYDTDSSGAYSCGNVYPIAYSEEFRYFPDTLELPPRWSVQDIIFDLDYYEPEVTESDTLSNDAAEEEE